MFHVCVSVHRRQASGLPSSAVCAAAGARITGSLVFQALRGFAAAGVGAPAPCGCTVSRRSTVTQLRRAAPSMGESTRVRPTFAACTPAVGALLLAEGTSVAGGRGLTRFRWAAGSGRARSGGRRCERMAVPQAVVVVRLCTSLTWRCTWAASLTEQSKQDPKQTPPRLRLWATGTRGRSRPVTGQRAGEADLRRGHRAVVTRTEMGKNFCVLTTCDTGFAVQVSGRGQVGAAETH